MKSFLVRNKVPQVRWSKIPDNTYFEGNVPESYSLAISPSKGYVILDVDEHGEISGDANIPFLIKIELQKTLNYPTKGNGVHYWLKYSGNKELTNKPSGLGIDLRTHRGYAIWYDKRDIRECNSLIKESSRELNEWLEKLFYNKKVSDE